MSTDRETTRIVRSWLHVDEHESADRVLAEVLATLDATPQRRLPWPAWRTPIMGIRLAVAAAAVVIAAVIGINLLPAGGLVGGPAPTPTVPPSSSPSASPSPSPSPSPSLRPEPTPEVGAIPPAGALKVGRHSFSQGGVSFTLATMTEGWLSGGIAVSPDGGWLAKGTSGTTSAAWVLLWGIDGVYDDPCHRLAAPPAGPSADDLAAAVAAIPGVKSAGPTDVTVGGYPAKQVVVTITDQLGCSPNSFNLWYDDVRCGQDDPCNRYASFLGSTIRVWIVDVAGQRVWIEAETYANATDEITAEIQQLIDSVQFE